MTRYGMVVDLNRCVGCQTCTIACKHANDTLPGVQWRRVLDVEYGAFPDVERVFLVVGCQHCADPPCVPVCPSGATKQRADGLVTMDYDTCIGCAYCAVSCPYQARTIVHDREGYYGDLTTQENHVAHDDRINVANKCTFCVGRIDDAKALGLTPGVDPEVTPACAVSCISKAIRFGDFADPDSEVSTLARDNRSFQMHAELGTDPQIRYLYEVPATTPGRDPDAGDADDAVLSDPSNPLVGQRQKFWDYRAAMNFAVGGMGAGLGVVAWLAWIAGVIGMDSLRILHVVAATAMSVGLFFVFLKIGRKMRFLNVLLRPQSSWMTRETWCVAVFYPAVGANLLWPHSVFATLAGVAAGGFLLSQALILYKARGIPTWRAPLMPWMLTATGLFEGVGLAAVATALSVGEIPYTPAFALAGIGLAVTNAMMWRCYNATAKQCGIGPLSRRDLSSISIPLLSLGHSVPALLFALAFGVAVGPVSASILAGLGGTAAVAGGMLWKFWIVTRACHQQGFALPKIPQRGSGLRAAPERLAPV